MRFTKTDVLGARVIDPTPHQDDSGRFLRAWCSREFFEHGINFVPVQAKWVSARVKGRSAACTSR
jgi:dTDP-4-dehydrorhamnose 3,5-epimerase